MAKKTKQMSKKKIGVGVAVATTAAAAAAGAYLLYGSKNAAKNRKVVKGWVNDAKKEVAEQVKKAKQALSKADYERMVDQAMKKYHKLSATGSSEVNKLTRDIKREWKNFVGVPAKRKVSKAKRVVKKTAKKGSKKK